MGTKVLEAHRVNGFYQGEYLSWWDNGNLKEKGLYKNGHRTGSYFWFKEDGTLLKTYEYENEE